VPPFTATFDTAAIDPQKETGVMGQQWRLEDGVQRWSRIADLNGRAPLNGFFLWQALNQLYGQ